MWWYVFHQVRRQPGKSILASSGFLLAACALVLLSATTQTTVVRVAQSINQNWRPTYDLIVLPPQSHIAGQKTVPADVLAGYNGGISVQQYQQIKKLPGISVAAPIAYLGYLSLPAPVVYSTDDLGAPGYYRVEWVQRSFNGQRQIVESHETIFILRDDSSSCHFSSSDAAALKMHNERVAAFEQRGIYYLCATEYDAQGNPLPNVASRALIAPSTEKFLLAAIDPTDENQLVKLDQSVTKGRMLTEQDTATLNHAPQFLNNGQKLYNYNFPLLVHESLPGQTTLHLTYTRLAADALTPAQALARGSHYLSTLRAQRIFIDQDVPLAERDPDLFSTVNLTWDGHSWQKTLTNNGFGISTNGFSDLSTPSSLNYQPASGPAEWTGAAYQLRATGTQGPEATFRNLNRPNGVQKKSATDLIVYTYIPVGQFTDTRLAAQFSNQLNWLPESTYTISPSVLRYDAQGHPVPPTALLPTTNTAGYLIQPPLALTTLSAAQQMRGDTPIISAIRVRVAGVDRANAESWQRVQQVAAQIKERTHLQVLVTLGSSPRPTLVYVPGIKQGQSGAAQDIAPVGWVEERWIALGASILYLTQLGGTRFLLLGTVFLVCLGYLGVAFSALVTAQRRDFAILSALGWRPWQLVYLFLAQAILFALCGSSIGLGIALVITWLLGALPLWLLVAWTLPITIGMALLSSCYPLWQIWQILPAEILRANSFITSSRHRIWSLHRSIEPSYGGLVLRNLARSRPRTLITIGSLFLSTVLLVLMISGILTLRQTLQGTLLGDFVLLQTAIPQVAGCIFAVVLTFLSMADLLLLQVRERSREIGLLQAIGWRAWQVQRLFVQEGILLALLGTLPGVLVAQGVLSLQHAEQSIIPTPLLALSASVFLLLVTMLASFPALRVMNRMQIIHMLHAA